ncbi:hypothetical protein [Janibacter alittae]|uniref:Sortase n=1 Tax=Janibacter alittae TaxID=3115209 RepID=A0ABZ2MH71_9MICO
MTRFSSVLKLVLLVAGVSLVVGGVASIIVGGVTLAQGNDPVRLTVSEGPEVVIPSDTGLLGGSVMVYTAEPASDSPRTLGCELIEDDGDVASGTRVGDVDFALGDPVTVEGTTWYPFTQVELQSEPATLTCSGDTLAGAALSEQSVFGRSTALVGLVALGAGVLGLAMGIPALIAGWTIRR